MEKDTKATAKATAKKPALKAKTYRLLDDKGGKSFLLKVGRKNDLLVFDESAGYNRAIKHCPNERSIFSDEQSELGIVVPIMFEAGYLNTEPTEVQTQRFLDAHPDNKANAGGLFEEVNEEENAKEDIKRDEIMLDIKQAIRNKGNEKDGVYALESLTAVLRGSLVGVRDMTKDEMKREIYAHVDKDPERFIDAKGNVNIFEDESVNRKYIALRAVSDGVIVVAPNNRSIQWASDKATIINVPIGVKPIEHLAEYLATDDGILVLDEIVKRS